MTRKRNTRTRDLIRAAALLMLGVTALSAGHASAAASDALRHRLHSSQGLYGRAHPVQLAGPGRCLIRQVRPDGTVVFIDRCAQESATKRPAIALRRSSRAIR